MTKHREIPITQKVSQYIINICRICGCEIRKGRVYCGNHRYMVNSLKKRRRDKTTSEIEKEIIEKNNDAILSQVSKSLNCYGN